MKWLYVYILLVVLSTPVYSQLDTCFTQQEIINISSKIVNLEEDLQLKTDIVDILEDQIEWYDLLHKQDSIYISTQARKLIFLESTIKQYEEAYNIKQPKWHESKFFWFGLGVSTIYLSSVIVSNIK